MKGLAAVGGGLIIVAAITGWHFFKKTDSHEPAATGEENAAAAVKQEINTLKSLQFGASGEQKPRHEIVLQPEFGSALRSEIIGDEQFDSKDYAAAEKSYSEALNNFRKALEKSRLDPASQAPSQEIADLAGAQQSAISRTTTKALNDEIKNLSQEYLERERKSLATADSEREASPNATFLPPESSFPTNSIAIEERPTRTVSIPDAGGEHSRERAKTAKSGKPETEEVSTTASETTSGEAPASQAKPVDAPVGSISNSVDNAQPKSQNREQAQEAARREIADLISSYQNSLSTKNLASLDVLFQKNFSDPQKKAWSDFFTQATALQVTVEGRSHRIVGTNAEVDLIIIVNYANRKGLQQKPLRYAETWTLAKQNSTWTIVARKFE